MPKAIISNSIFDPKEGNKKKLEKMKEVLEAKKEELKIYRKVKLEEEEKIKKMKKPLDI